MKATLKRENARPWHEVEEEFENVEYRKVRDRQMRELEMEDDIMSKIPIRYAPTLHPRTPPLTTRALSNLRAKLYKESFEFVRQQRIHCLLEGAWFMNGIPLATTVSRDTLKRPTRPWRFLRLVGPRQLCQ